MNFTKEELIGYIDQLPDNIKIFTSSLGDFDDVDIRIFIKPKSKEFYDWYFGI